jgi:hypothetical protein
VALRRVALLALVLTFVAACGGGAPSSRASATPGSAATPSGAPGASAEPTSRGATVEPVPSDEPVESEEPVASEEPIPTEEPGATDEPVPSDEPVESPAASGGPEEPGAAAACTGSDDNRAFFEGIARRADWPVLCGVLPGGWFVSQGSYRLANGGKLLISYKGPGGATIALSQGAFCSSTDGCVPDGSELGGAALGSLDGTLYETADGFAIIAAPGENPSWLMTTKGLDQASAVAFAGALAEVGR